MRTRFNPRLARKKAQAQQRQPGQVSPTLRRRMGDALADVFDEFGPDIYTETVLALKNDTLEKLKKGFNDIDQATRDELGRRGVEESRKHIREWSQGLIEDITTVGLDEVSGSVEDYVSTLANEFMQSADEGGEDELLTDVEGNEEPEVIEEEPAEPAEPAAPAEEPASNTPELNLENVEVPELNLEGAGAGLARARFPRRRPPVFQRRGQRTRR